MATRDINSLTIIGRLTANPDYKVTQGGTSLLKFSIANNSGKDDKVSFFNCLLWGKIAEALQPYMSKGQQVCINGRIQQNRWQAEDGSNRSRVEIVAENIQLLGGKRQDQGTPAQEGQYQPPEAQQATPAAPPVSAAQTASAAPHGAQGAGQPQEPNMNSGQTGNVGPMNDQIPF